MSDQILLYDTTLRDGTQRENISLSRNDKVKIAQRLDAFGIPYIEGGWPGSNPKDVEFFARIREVPLAAGQDLRLRLDAPQADPLRSRRQHPDAARGANAGGHAGGQELGPPRARGDRDHAGREPGDDRGQRALSEARRQGAGLRRRALLRRLEGEPGVRARHAARRRRGRRRLRGPVRHQRRRAAVGGRGDRRRGRGRCSRPGSASTPTTTPVAGWRTRWPRCAPAP